MAQTRRVHLPGPSSSPANTASVDISDDEDLPRPSSSLANAVHVDISDDENIRDLPRPSSSSGNPIRVHIRDDEEMEEIHSISNDTDAGEDLPLVSPTFHHATSSPNPITLDMHVDSDGEISTVSRAFNEGTQERSNQSKFPYYGSEEDQGPPVESEDSDKYSEFQPDAILSPGALMRTVSTRSKRSQHSPPATQAESSRAWTPTREHVPYF